MQIANADLVVRKSVRVEVPWFLASLMANHGARLRPALAAFAIGYLLFAVNSFRYFFIAPVVVEVLISVSLFAAIATTRREPEYAP